MDKNELSVAIWALAHGGAAGKEAGAEGGGEGNDFHVFALLGGKGTKKMTSAN